MESHQERSEQYWGWAFRRR